MALLLSERKMKTLVMFGILLYVSSRVQATVVEVFEEAQSVLLPCLYGGIIPEEDPAVIWTRNDHNSQVFFLREGGSDPEGQNQIYRGRTSMNPDALETGNYSLTFRKPQQTDSGNYICSITDGVKTLKLTEAQLNVKDVQLEVKVNRDAEFIVLPCKTSAGLPKDTRVEWTRSEPGFMLVHVYPNTSAHNAEREKRYCGRTAMNEDLLRTGDVSLTLREPTARDNGRYVCTVYRDKDILRQRVVLEQVQPLEPEGAPVWVTVLLVLLVLLVLGLSGGALFNFRHYFIPVQQVEVDSGTKSVLLPCRARPFLPSDARVEWMESQPWKVHVYENGSDQLRQQRFLYRNRTRMNENPLRTGDLSLTLKWPFDRDIRIYTCTVFNRDGKILMKKQVQLHVIIQQVKVEAGVESVLLPCRATKKLPGKAKVEWTDKDSEKVHVYENGSDQHGEQSQFYRTRTKMNENPLKTGNLSLTLKSPTDRDSRIYTCTVFNRDGRMLMRKQVELHVRIQPLEVEAGVESVLLPCRATRKLPGKAKVEWMDKDRQKVHVYENGSDQPGEQMQFYRTRTKMNEDLLKTGDLSLTLRWPTIGDQNLYTCRVSNGDGVTLMVKRVKLQVKVQLIEVDPDVESVLLPCRTTGPLPGDARVEWIKSPDKKVHVYENGSDQPGEQSQFYRTRTKMDDESLRTGDLSLTLSWPTDGDNEIYTCKVSSSNGDVLMKKQVQLKVKVHQVEAEEGAESVLLPFRTTSDLPGDAKLEWRKGTYVTVHVYQNNSDQPEKQNQIYTNRTRMDKDLLKTGNISLTVRSPTERDSGEYRCLVCSLKGDLQREKTVLLKVKERRQIHERTPLIPV